MAVKYSPWGNQQFVDENGAPAYGWKLKFYAAGSSTAQSTFTDADGDTPNPNEIVLNALGMADNQIWLTEGLAYKGILTDENDVVKDTQDDLEGINDTSVDLSQWLASAVTPTYVSATSFTVPGDQTTAFHAYRRFKATVTAGTVYGAIASASYNGTTLTTVTVTNDSGALDVGLSAISLGVVTATNTSLPKIPNFNTSAEIADDAIIARHLADSALGFSMVNGTLTASVALNALTIAIKTKAGTDPSATDPVHVLFRNTTQATGDYSVISLTAATSLIVSSGSTLGTANATLARLWIVGINDSGTFRLGAVNLSTPLTIGNDVLVSATAEGGAGAADSAGVIYAGTAVTSKPMRVLGYIEVTQAAAGTWVTAPSKIQLYSDVHSVSPLQPTIASGTAQTTVSGTAIDFTGIPSWVKRVTLNFAGVSTSGTSNPQVQIGDSGGIENTGYLSSAVYTVAANTTAANSTTGFLLASTNTAAGVWHGTAVLALLDASANTWVISGSLGRSDGAAVATFGGSKSLSTTLDRIRLTTVGGTETFDAGQMNILYE